MMLTEENVREEAVIALAKQIAVAARTAPKAKGCDNVEIVILTGNDIEKLATTMCEIADKENYLTFMDDKNVKHREAQ